MLCAKARQAIAVDVLFRVFIKSGRFRARDCRMQIEVTSPDSIFKWCAMAAITGWYQTGEPTKQLGIMLFLPFSSLASVTLI